MGLLERMTAINNEKEEHKKESPKEPARVNAEKSDSSEMINLATNVAKVQAGDRYIVKGDVDGNLKKLKDETHKEVTRILSKQAEVTSLSIKNLVEEYLEETHPEVDSDDALKIAKEIIDEIVGLGPLEDLLNDESVSEVMVNGPNQVYVERKGKLLKTDITFEDDAHVRRTIDRIVSPLGRRIDDSNPMVDARLEDGSRVNAIIPPLSLVGSTLTIRKFTKDPLTIDNLKEFGSLSEQMAGFLEASVKGRLNILVSGGTGSGKTTLLNVLSAYIPANERIVTIEDAAELKLMQEHVVSLESRPANLEGNGAITIRDLVRNALRMRPDRIIVGEVRGGETLDMLQAMNTGHDGSITTAHANSARDCLARLETMVMMSGMEFPVSAIRQQIAGAIDLIVQQARLRDGTRKIISISEVTGMEGDIITLQEIFSYQQKGYDENHKSIGEFVSTGIRPKCCEKIMISGVAVEDYWFINNRF